MAGGPAPAQPPRDFGAASTSAARGTAEPGPWKRARRSGQLQSWGRGHGDPAVSGRGSLAPNFARGDGHSPSGIFLRNWTPLPLAAPREGLEDPIPRREPGL